MESNRTQSRWLRSRKHVVVSVIVGLGALVVLGVLPTEAESPNERDRGSKATAESPRADRETETAPVSLPNATPSVPGLHRTVRVRPVSAEPESQLAPVCNFDQPACIDDGICLCKMLPGELLEFDYCWEWDPPAPELFICTWSKVLPPGATYPLQQAPGIVCSTFSWTPGPEHAGGDWLFVSESGQDCFVTGASAQVVITVNEPPSGPDPCSSCGPGPHWVDGCSPAGTDTVPSGALVGIDFDLDEIIDANLVALGDVTILRSEPQDLDTDGHFDTIETEIVQMQLTGPNMTLTAGAGLGIGSVLAPSLGQIVENPTNDLEAASFFDVFVEIDLGAGKRLYNHEPIRVAAVIECVPPKVSFDFINELTPLYTSPDNTGVHIANLGPGQHDTFPDPPWDHWTTWLPPDEKDPNDNFHDFTGDPIPMDFFDPGSDPFIGRVLFKSKPLDPENLGDADTTILRSADPFLPTDPVGPTQVTVDIEIVELSLKSVAPIVVTYPGNRPDEVWDVFIDLADPNITPQQMGTLTATKTHMNGGTFTATLPVLPRFTFTRRIDGTVRVFDTGAEGLPAVVLQTPISQPGDWAHSADPASGIFVKKLSQFIVGVNPATGMPTLTREEAMWARHTVCPPRRPGGGSKRRDRWNTWRDDDKEKGMNYQDFSTQPIPGDFFCPDANPNCGSDPFNGKIEFSGNPLEPADWGDADTYIDRLGDPVLPGAVAGTMGTVDIEIVQLSLSSVEPITVTYNGGLNPEIWDVTVDLSTVSPGSGTMTATKTHANGGTFDTTLPVQPRLTFNRRSDGLERVFDTGVEGHPALILTGADAPFVHTVNPGLGVLVDASAQFVPGVEETTPGDINSQVVRVITEDAALAKHSICPPRPAKPDEGWFWKDWNNADPDGYMPDYDQNKDYDLDGAIKRERCYCGPTAIANSLWWFEHWMGGNGTVVPLAWDKLDLVEELAFLMGTKCNGNPLDPLYPSPSGRPGPYAGTYVDDMQLGIDQYLQNMGIDSIFYEHTERKPTFQWIADEVLRSQDVTVLIGFWEIQEVLRKTGGYDVRWRRTGGHYMTVAGVNKDAKQLAFSDPDGDQAEFGAKGVVRGPDHDHDGDGDQATIIPFRDPLYDHYIHNDKERSSHDIYDLKPSFSPGGKEALLATGDPLFYAGFMADFHECESLILDDGGDPIACSFDQFFTNVDDKFLKQYKYPIPQVGQQYTEVEYAVAVSPKEACCLPNGGCLDIRSGADLRTCKKLGGKRLGPGSECAGVDMDGNGVDDACDPCRPDCDAEGKQNVECLNMAATANEYANRTPVGRIVIHDGGQSVKGFCTGWIIAAPDCIMTNRHCVTTNGEVDGPLNDVTRMTIEFNYECEDCVDGHHKPIENYRVTSLLHENVNLDYALLKVEGNPAAVWGVLAVDPTTPQAKEEIYEIHHAGGLKKGYDDGIVKRFHNPGICIDTTIAEIAISPIASGGASGSPVFKKENHCVTAICHCGPRCKPGFAVPMSFIMPDALPHIQAAGCVIEPLCAPIVNEACCLPDETCVDIDPKTCKVDLGGTAQGTGTSCADDVCGVRINLDRPDSDPAVDIVDPTGDWHELWPNFCNDWVCNEWLDNESGVLDECDYLRMEKTSTMSEEWYHVENVTATLTVTEKVLVCVGGANDGMACTTDPECVGGSCEDQGGSGGLLYLDFQTNNGNNDIVGALGNPIGSTWHEVAPAHCQLYNVVDWIDNLDDRLSFCDQILLQNKVTGDQLWYHIEAVSTDIEIRREDPPPTCFPSSPPVAELIPNTLQQPVVSAKNRYISVTAGDAGQQQAVRVTFSSLPGPYATWNGTQMFVQMPTEVCNKGGVLSPTVAASCNTGVCPGGICRATPAGGVCDGGANHGASCSPVETFWAAGLGCSPFYTDWTAYPTIHIHHEGIIPDGEYAIDVIELSCPFVDASFSTPLTITNSRHGDVAGAFKPGFGQNSYKAPDTSVDIAPDFTAAIDAFRGTATAPIKPRADVEFRNVDLIINITDAVQIIDAFRGLPYPYTPSGGPPCP